MPGVDVSIPGMLPVKAVLLTILGMLRMKAVLLTILGVLPVEVSILGMLSVEAIILGTVLVANIRDADASKIQTLKMPERISELLVRKTSGEMRWLGEHWLAMVVRSPGMWPVRVLLEAWTEVLAIVGRCLVFSPFFTFAFHYLSTDSVLPLR